MIVRKEQASDQELIWDLNSVSYGTNAEANLVNELRDSGCEFLSIVAEHDHRIVGHILFTPVELLDDLYQINDARIMGLAPMAVAEEFRNQGIGSALIEAGLKYCKIMDYDAVVVLGHSNYYPKFGFKTSTEYNIKSEYDVPEEVFMIREIIKDSLYGLRGTIIYHDQFNKVA